jgi:chemotaxis signal transduction protein
MTLPEETEIKNVFAIDFRISELSFMVELFAVASIISFNLFTSTPVRLSQEMIFFFHR